MTTATSDAATIALITDAQDFSRVFEVCAKAFGEQTADGIWTVASPGWDTAQGKVDGAARMAARWQKTRASGNTHFVKASVPSSDSAAPLIVGIAIWLVASEFPDHGDALEPLDFTDLYPKDKKNARFLQQILGSMQRYRRQVVKDAARPESEKNSVMILDLCALDPVYQRRGIAGKLVQWGLDEAKRRGGIEAITEASVMGRSVYKRLGFQEVEEIEYEVDDEFRNRSQPSNVFLRTKPPRATPISA
jgi:GNAT superfamily N-acetyltransferase